MQLKIYDNSGNQLLTTIDVYPICGIDYCEYCGQCIACFDNRHCDHIWQNQLNVGQSLEALLSTYSDRLVDKILTT
jgi:hypothetical protein